MDLDKKQLDKLAATAKHAVYEAGSYLLNAQDKFKIIENKSPRGRLLDTDLKAEEIITKILNNDFPEYDIYSEETSVFSRDLKNY